MARAEHTKHSTKGTHSMLVRRNFCSGVFFERQVEKKLSRCTDGDFLRIFIRKEHFVPGTDCYQINYFLLLCNAAARDAARYQNNVVGALAASEK